MAKKIEIINGYFKLTETTRGEINIFEPVSNLKFKRSGNAYYFYYKNAQSEVFEGTGRVGYLESVFQYADFEYSDATKPTSIEELDLFLAGVFESGYTSQNVIGWRGNSLVSQSVGSVVNGTITLAENQLFANKVSYSGGELTFLETGTFSIFIELHLDVTSGQNAIIETWIEYDLGGGFIPYPESGRFLKFGVRTEGVISYKSDLEIVQGVKFRLKARAKSGSIDLISSVLDNGVASPSTLVSIIKEK